MVLQGGWAKQGFCGLWRDGGKESRTREKTTKNGDSGLKTQEIEWAWTDSTDGYFGPSRVADLWSLAAAMGFSLTFDIHDSGIPVRILIDDDVRDGAGVARVLLKALAAIVVHPLMDDRRRDIERLTFDGVASLLMVVHAVQSASCRSASRNRAVGSVTTGSATRGRCRRPGGTGAASLSMVVFLVS